MPDEAREGAHGSADGPHTFLIADLRGYTRYVDAGGDEAASVVASRFAALVRDAVAPHGGRVLELRGDEALCMFQSARAALATAVELQRRCREPENGSPVLPLGVGIGLDAGEAVPTEGAYRGRALNVAARLCSLARGGEILASETVRNLAGAHPLASYAARRPVQVKGVGEPVRFVEVLPNESLPPVPAEPRAPRPRRTPLVAGLLGVVLAAAAVVSLLAFREDSTGETASSVVIPPNSVAVVDPSTNRVVDVVAAGDLPGPIAAGAGSVWVGNVGENTLMRVDPESREVVRTIGLPVTPDWLAFAADSLWIVDTGCDWPCRTAQLQRSEEMTLTRFDPYTERIGQPLTLGPGGLYRVNVAADKAGTWVTNASDARLYRVDPLGARIVAELQLSSPGGVAVGGGAVWVIDGATVVRIDPETNSISATIDVGGDPEGIAAERRSVWVSNFGPEGGVWRIDARLNEVRATVPVESAPTAVVTGGGGVWVNHYQQSLVSRVDPDTNEVTSIRLGRIGYVSGVGGGLVWVTAR